jgi:HSP20 family protein
MSIERWDPFRDVVSLRDAVNNLFQESFVRPSAGLPSGGAGTLPVDIVETESEFVVKASLPGFKPEDIHTTILSNNLMIRGESKAEEEKKNQHWVVRERRVGSFQRSVSLNVPINADKASASYEHGVLTLTLPKAETAKPKQIKIGGR